MRYCSRCIIPETRPNITFDAEGVCNACRYFDSRASIDWQARAASFRAVVESARSRSRGYDCVVPVSGGKDSFWQVALCCEHGLNVLAVTWRPPGRTAIGQTNLETLVQLGVDHVDFTVNPEVESRFTLTAFERFGSTAIPMHMGIFNIPPRIAVGLGVPLIVWGENTAFEYGGTDDEQTGFRLDAAWLRRFGVTHGTTAEDWVGPTLSRQELTPYFPPADEDLEKAGTLGVFAGYHIPWDPENSLRLAEKHGFARSQTGPRTGYYDYADIDDDFISLHHWMKWLKFGFTRAYDNLSLEIRHGRIPREEAVERLQVLRDDRPPLTDIRKFCAHTGIEESRFFEIAESFRNSQVWRRDGAVWQIDDFIAPNWEWE